jgi:ankyrin repeat protein
MMRCSRRGLIFLVFWAVSLQGVAAAQTPEETEMFLKEMQKHQKEQAQISDNELIRAAGKGDWRAVERLLDQGADPNVVDSSGKTALTAAASRGYPEVVKTLLNAGADLNPDPEKGRRGHPLFLAVFNGHEDVVEVLLDHGAEMDAQDAIGRTPLMNSALRNHADIARLLLNRGADVNVRDQLSETALFLAHDVGIVRDLLDHGAAVDARDLRGRTFLMRAATGANKEIVQALLDHGADVNAKDDKGRTALMIAEKPGMRVFLINNGADVNARDGNGNTALMHSVLNGRVREVEILLDWEADTRIRNNDGQTALDLAKEKRYDTIVEILEK